MGMSTMELAMEGGQLLACSLASDGEWGALGWPMLGVGLLGTWRSLDLVCEDTGPKLWRLEEELAGLSKDLEDDWWLEMLEWRRDWLLPNTQLTSDARLDDSTETLPPSCGAGPPTPFSRPGEATSGEPKPGGPEALCRIEGMEMLGDEGGREEGAPAGGEGRWWPLPWLPEKIRLSLLLRVSQGMSRERRRPPLRGEPKGGVTDGLEQLWGPSWHLDLAEVTSMYFISKASGSSFFLLDVVLWVGSAQGLPGPGGSSWKVGSSSRIIWLRLSSEKSM